MSASSESHDGADRLVAVGVDGAPRGWVVTACWSSPTSPATERRTEPLFFTSIDALVRWRAEQPGGAGAPVAVDMPIGMPGDVGFRPCDVEARKRLPGARKSSVFHAPGRYLLDQATAPTDGEPPGAKVVFRRVQKLVAERQRLLDETATDNGPATKLLRLSSQGAALLLKMAEVDAFIRKPSPAGEADPQTWMFEVHPEMCFLAMNDAVPLASKTSAHGQLRRLDLVHREFPDALDRIRAWADGGRHALLDVCDAYASCWSAIRWRLTSGGRVERRADVEPPLEVLGEQSPGRSPREAETALLMRMVV